MRPPISRVYVLEVDLGFPEAIHEWLCNLPPCYENIVPPNTTSQSKLIASLLPKRRYVLHVKNLTRALALGVKLVEIHRCLSFA